METSQFVNVYVPESLLGFGPFSERQKIYGYQHTVSLERGSNDEVQHTLVVRQTEPPLACGPMPCGAPLLLLGEITPSCAFSDAHSRITQRENNSKNAGSIAIDSRCNKSKSNLPPDEHQFGRNNTQETLESGNTVQHISRFWLSFCVKPFLHLTRVQSGSKDLNLQNVNVIFYSAEEIRDAQLLCNKYICDGNINSSLSFFICKVKHEPRDRKTSSLCFEFVWLFVLSLVYLMKGLMFLPRQCMKLQFIFSKVFDFQSATLTQLGIRVTQLEEMLRIYKVSEPAKQQSFASWSCSCRFSCLKDEEESLQSNRDREKHCYRNTFSEECAGKAQNPEKLCNPSSKSGTCKDCSSDPKKFNLDPHKTSSKKCSHGGCHHPSTSISCTSGPSCCHFSSVHSDTLVLVRLLCVVLVDVLLGLLLLRWMISVGNADVIYDIFLSLAEDVSRGVLQLLSWLKGAPAGLKLNQPLSVALATFFSYHVGLWTLYLEVAGIAVYSLCCVLVYSGVLGATVQFALLSDLLHFATLHLHCFYVYAARLHMVQVSLLGSQWRAFRGNKWNPLKLRVDSLHSRPSPVHHPARDPFCPTRISDKSKSSFDKDDSTRHNPTVTPIEASDRHAASNLASHAQQSTSQLGFPVQLEKWFSSGSSQSVKNRRSSKSHTNTSLDNQHQLPIETEVESSNRNVTQSLTSRGFTTPVSGNNVCPSLKDEYDGSRAPLSRVVSAIIFTLVVFLLPTTTVYYVVFLSLRLLLLVARELLRLIPWLIHHNPAFAPCVLLCHPRALAGEVEFQAFPGGVLGGSGPVALRVNARTSSLTAVVSRFAASSSLPALTPPSPACIASSVLWAKDLL